MKQTTIKYPVSLEGPVVHDDRASLITLRPAPLDHGIVFLSSGVRIPALVTYLNEAITKWTTLSRNGVDVHCVEHLLSAIGGMGITNLVVEVKGSGIPFLDGSSQGFVDALSDPEEQDKECFVLPVTPKVVYENAIDFETGKVTSRRSFLCCFPWPTLRVMYDLDYQGVPLPAQLEDLEITTLTYASLSRARTFMTTWEIERWRGTLLGHKFCDAIPKIPFEERIENEAAKHKILDIIGDIALLGLPARGMFIGIRSGHSLNKKLVRKLCWS